MVSPGTSHASAVRVLLWGTELVPVRAEHTAVTRLWSKERLAAHTLVEEYAAIGGHRFRTLMITVGARQRDIQIGHSPEHLAILDRKPE
jgi:hypothetical protein